MSGLYKLTIKKSAAKSLESLPAKAAKPIIEAILDLPKNPRPNGCKKLHGKLNNLYRIRIGHYRVLYLIDDTIRIIDVQDVGHRKDIYD
ncbi:MAG: type II toxin-antitoxin system RelE/ParE family toxin [Bacteroidia bacterium]|jgi:mRNA interferase RelE/StbE|nr:type II toxin-antitoxin system RelE/ParE family toxin [Bacteroidia bacterium]